MSDIDTVNAREQELQQRMLEFVAEGCEGNLPWIPHVNYRHCVKQGKATRNRREVTETIQKLKFLLSDTIAELDIDENRRRWRSSL
ncbi:hypothetical protein INT80_15425 [Gallibacterium anatis]|uniref:Uncharacterized protein n=1 Tax=Gallibacterium anatis TaxID=750 RepID=A0A930UXX7_9PAST|nr:hypothetical protein [Gallibacterium anatis]